MRNIPVCATFVEVRILDKLFPNHVFYDDLGKGYRINHNTAQFEECGENYNIPSSFASNVHTDNGAEWYMPNVGYYDPNNKTLTLEKDYNRLRDLGATTLQSILDTFPGLQYIEVSSGDRRDRTEIENCIKFLTGCKNEQTSATKNNYSLGRYDDGLKVFHLDAKYPSLRSVGVEIYRSFLMIFLLLSVLFYTMVFLGQNRM